MGQMITDHIISNRDEDFLSLDQNLIKSLEYRCEVIRRDILEGLFRYGRGHAGPSLSEVEILTTLYFRELRLNPQDPKWPERDRFILSKGHGALGYYVVLAQRGLIKHEELSTFETLGSRLQGHVDSIRLPWVELTTGSLGQGLSVALGIAIGAQKLGKDIRSYCMLGDLLAIVDWNGLQGGVTMEVMPSLEPFADKWRSFGWHAIDLPGHDIAALLDAYREARQIKGQPTVIIARTVKGKGYSFMENQVEWHSGTVTKELYEIGMHEVNARLSTLSAYSVGA
jgi:transketolase